MRHRRFDFDPTTTISKLLVLDTASRMVSYFIPRQRVSVNANSMHVYPTAPFSCFHFAALLHVLWHPSKATNDSIQNINPISFGSTHFWSVLFHQCFRCRPLVHLHSRLITTGVPLHNYHVALFHLWGYTVDEGDNCMPANVVNSEIVQNRQAIQFLHPSKISSLSSIYLIGRFLEQGRCGKEPQQGSYCTRCACGRANKHFLGLNPLYAVIFVTIGCWNT
jgi:hypothetical protein